MIHANVLNVAHQANKKFVKYIWWYSIEQDRLEGYDLVEVEKHSNSKFTLINEELLNDRKSTK